MGRSAQSTAVMILSKKLCEQIWPCLTAHHCTPPAGLEPEALGMNLTQWKNTFLPIELARDFQMKPSMCRMYNVTNETVAEFLDPSTNVSLVPVVSCRDVNGYTYDQRYETMLRRPSYTVCWHTMPGNRHICQNFQNPLVYPSCFDVFLIP